MSNHPQPHCKPRLISYIRWSSQRQASGTTIERQTEAARLYAAENNLEYHEIRDEGVSAFKGRNSKKGELADFIADVESGAIPSDSWLYVENLDRLSRATVRNALKLLLHITDLGVTVVTGMDGKVYSAKAMDNDFTDLMMSLLLFSRANEESRTKQKRVFGNVAALVERHKQGLPINIKSAGSSPWWIDGKGSQYEAVKPHPVHWDAAKKAIELFLQGWGCYRVAAYLNEHSDIYPPPKGNKGKGMKRGQSWAVANLKKMRVNRASIGEKVLTVNGQTYRLDGYFPPLCSETEFARIQEITESNKIPQGEQKKVITMLSGLGVLRCGHCGGSMSFFSHVGRLRYVCETGKNQTSACRVWSIQGRLVESLTARAIIYGHIGKIFSGEEVTESLAPMIEDRKAALVGLHEKMTSYTTAIGLGKNLPMLVEALSVLEGEKSRLLLEIDKLQQREALRGSKSDIDERVLSVIGLFTPKLMDDITHPDRTQIREIVRVVLPTVTFSKSVDKILKVDFKFTDNTHLIYEGMMKGKEKSFREYRKAADGTVIDDFYKKFGKLFADTVESTTRAAGIDPILFAEAIRSTAGSVAGVDPLHAALRRMAAAIGLPELNGKDFFGKR
ncbi:recombinase family protein [Kluyvera ascorbata]|uniref:recombinase family protein n=1 Tax=Kluyvera ascorbata TaxID=51288 RepID=UPI0039F7164A